jgi:hypothetical protein
MARAYAGTVMIEGTTLSEGRGTTRPASGTVVISELPAFEKSTPRPNWGFR